MTNKALPKVSIVLSDRSWILERLGSEIASRVPNVSLNDHADPSADINYYITFACRKEPAPTLEMGWFAHMEQSEHLQDLFYRTAREIDLPVTHSKLYRDMLHKEGISNAIAIAPGVDHDRFRPKLRVGVVGRTYHTGRKGEGIIAELMDMEGIDWHFTGTGWPLPGKHLPDDELPDFYRSMDYILVPALYEGGPMCVPEALAVGTPVIASNVGWVPEFPHIPFENGNAADLRRVLNELLDVKIKLHQSTVAYSWDRFAEVHDRAFNELVAAKGNKRASLGLPPLSKPLIDEPVRLLMHGSEATTLGGPSVRVPRTAKTLAKMGIQATADNYRIQNPISENLVHLFNVWHPNSAMQAMRALKASGKTVVFSPIYLELGERDFWNQALPKLAVEADEETLSASYQDALQHIKGRGALSEALPGYNAMVREMVDLADHVIFLSEKERDALKLIGADVDPTRASMVRNPVDANLWEAGDPTLFREAYLKGLDGPQDYVICVGRIETRKNQLMLARAIKDLPLRLVLVGHEGSADYAQKIREIAGDQVLMVGRLEAGGEMLRSAIAGSKIFALPSWSEGASLAVLEAAASGANLVLSDRSSETEYFGNLATYCDPGDLNSLRSAIETALAMPDPQKRGQELQALVREHNSWDKYAENTAKAYATVLQNGPKEQALLQEQLLQAKPEIVLDITTLAHHHGRVTGISRVESELAAEFAKSGKNVRFISWQDSIQRFIEIPAKYATFGQARRYRESFEHAFRTEQVVLSPESTIYVAGSAWMQNRRYPAGLEQLKNTFGCGLIFHVHDLIPFKFPFWFESGYAPVFRQNFTRLAGIADHIVAISQSCAKDVREAMSEVGLPPVGISIIRQGDPVLTVANSLANSPVRDRMDGKKFVLAVGAIHTRKNYETLYRVWARYADERRHGDLHLVIVGGVAWNGKALAETIAADERVKHKIHILSGVSDEELAYLYENCLFTVFPSHYEGWGLPVAESLLKGKLCLASSSSSVPEIAPEVVDHIDPEDFLGWHHKISYYAGSAAARATREASVKNGYNPVTWTQTASQVIEITSQGYPRKGLMPILPGQAVNLTGQTTPLQLHYGADWQIEGDTHIWMRSPRASISVNVSKALGNGKSGVYLLLNQTSHVTDRTRELYRVSTKGIVLFERLVSSNSFPKQLLVHVPADAIENGVATLDFDMPLAATKGDSPHRGALRSIGLKSITLLDSQWSNPLHYMEQSEDWVLGDHFWSVDFDQEQQRRIVAPDMNYLAGQGMGTTRDCLYLYLPIDPRSGDQIMTINYRPIATQEQPLRLTFKLNGDVLGVQEHDNALRQSHEFVLPKAVLTKSMPSVLSISSDTMWSAEDLGLKPSNSFVGLVLQYLSFAPKDM